MNHLCRDASSSHAGSRAGDRSLRRRLHLQHREGGSEGPECMTPDGALRLEEKP